MKTYWRIMILVWCHSAAMLLGAWLIVRWWR